MPTDRTNFESGLGRAMLETVLQNKMTQKMLGELAECLSKSVLSKAVLAINNTLPLNDAMQHVLHNWSVQHSQIDANIGALFPTCEREYLRDTVEGHTLLLREMHNTLSLQAISSCETISELLKFIKVMDSMSYYYSSEACVKENVLEYNQIKMMIKPTEEELKIRTKRKAPLVAVTYGIKKEFGNDLVLASEQGCASGKAVHEITSSDERGITWFDKLARDDEAPGKTLPLVASVSASSARLWIMLLHLKVFIKPEGFFDLDKAQIFANTLMGYYVFCGHHSVLEVMEVWNRALDCLAIDYPSVLPVGIFEKSSVETYLPYGHVGGYHAFLHTSYVESVLEQAHNYAVEVEEWARITGIGSQSCIFNNATVIARRTTKKVTTKENDHDEAHEYKGNQFFLK